MNPFTTPRTWAVGELVTKAMLDTHIRDNEAWLQAVAEIAGAQGCHIADDCFYVPGTGATPFLNGGISASLTSGTVTLGASSAANPGQLLCNTVAGASNTAALFGPADQIILGTNELHYQGIVGLSALSDGSNTYTVRAGAGDSGTGESSDFVGFRYTHSVNGGEWQGVTRSNGTESTLDTNVTATAAFQRLAFVVNGAASLVTFSIAGTTVGTISTNIPTGVSRALTFLPGQIVKSVGTTSRSLIVDAYRYLIPTSR